MKNSILLIRFILKVRAVNRENGQYHRLVNKIAAPAISKSIAANDGSISRLHFLRIQWYMTTNLYLGELIGGLWSHKLTFKEKKALVFLGALMAITDLITDDFRLEVEKISMLLKGEMREPAKLSAIEKLFLLYHEELFSVIDNEKATYLRDFSLRKPHLESQLQMKKDISEAELLELTRKKGGTAILLTTSLLFDITESNKEAFYQLGAFIQYMNDSQDIFKDANASITTFVSFCNGFSEVNAKLKQEFDKTTALFLQTDFPQESLYKLLFYLNALYTGVLYKNKVFARKNSNPMDMKKIFAVENADNNVNMFSLSSFQYCLPRILRFSM